MGRPIKKKYFGNTNYPYSDTPYQLSGVGGEGLTSISFSNAGQFFAPITVAAPAPTIAGGQQAVAGTITYEANVMSTGAGKSRGGGNLAVGDVFTYPNTGGAQFTVWNIAGSNAIFTFTNAGSGITVFPTGGTNGYTQGINVTKVSGPGTTSTFLVDLYFHVKGNVPIVTTGTGYVGTETPIVTGTGGPTGGSVNLTSNRQNAIKITSYLSTGSSAVTGGDIIKQESSRRYLVVNSQGVGVCHLSSGTGAGHVLTPGNMHVFATDTAGATYYVMKLTAHKALLVNRTGTSTAVYSSFKPAPWSFSAPYVSTNGAQFVQIQNN